ncbi:hypothetical protein GQ53DRAFT_345124 [Thozetella sp. PMI_491]|nr:hypothetical protein GQ53DRAFT_345124 [Thozetella sp. PMI_491]
MASQKIYFGFGSNLWRDQMSKRCPSSPFLGIARLLRYRWQINERGYANIVETGQDGDEVWGLVYALPPVDEAELDINEGVPVAYEKRMLEADFWADEAATGVDTTAQAPEKTSMLVYIDFGRTVDSTPKEEYIYRMNQGIRDALGAGMPDGYVSGVLRKFIPDRQDEDAVRDEALRQASRFIDDNTL